MKHVFLFGIFGWFLSFTLVAQTGIWQWSVPVRNFSIHPKILSQGLTCGFPGSVNK